MPSKWVWLVGVSVVVVGCMVGRLVFSRIFRRPGTLSIVLALSRLLIAAAPHRRGPPRGTRGLFLPVFANDRRHLLHTGSTMLACLALSAVGFTSTMTARPRALPTRVGIPRCDGIDQVRLFAVKRAPIAAVTVLAHARESFPGALRHAL